MPLEQCQHNDKVVDKLESQIRIKKVMGLREHETHSPFFDFPFLGAPEMASGFRPLIFSSKQPYSRDNVGCPSSTAAVRSTSQFQEWSPSGIAKR